MLGVWHDLLGVWHEMLGVWHAMLGVWHAMLGVWHTKLGVWLRCWGNSHLVQPKPQILPFGFVAGGGWVGVGGG